MERDKIAARNRRLALVLVVFIFMMIAITILWMSFYNNLGA